MTEPNIDFTLNIEKIVHELLSLYAQDTWDKHKIRLDQVRFEWHDLQRMDSSDFRLKEVIVVSTTRPR